MESRFIWQDVVVHGPKTPPLTDGVVDSVQRRLGLRLPTRLVDLLRTQNGGTLRKRAYFIPPELEVDPLRPEIIVAVDEIYSLKQTSFQSPSDLDDVPDGLIAFGFERFSSGHMCLDYRACGPGGSPAVCLFSPCYTPKISPMAPSLDYLLDNLVIEELQDCFQILNPASFAAWDEIVRVFALKVRDDQEFNELDPLVAGTHQHWSAGYITGKARFHFGTNYDSGITVGFPELPEEALILRLDIHPRHREELGEHLRRLSFPVEPLRMVDWKLWAFRLKGDKQDSK